MPEDKEQQETYQVNLPENLYRPVAKFADIAGVHPDDIVARIIRNYLDNIGVRVDDEGGE
ncbi:MAG: hypothetical protein PVH29_06140 [Candidatus Zixiibacteriota bacterium]|jgi:inactivated superfamily I helicase